ncbi:MAG: PQQ-binding-like beta-propeller repeat protein [Candidatus Eremiobacteraeota bacterium]|nr:PQQ-binding-like beta-propeller repeat protein [Candidatus Eremiobacteraeota bacterium]
MEIRDRGSLIPGDRTQPQAAGNESPQAFANISDAFQKSASSAPPVDIKKAAGALLTGSTKKTAEVKWTKELSVMGSPVLAGSTLIVSDRYPDKALHAFDAKTGSELWQKKMGSDGPPPAVLAPDGSLLLVEDDGCLHALDPATGDDKWKLPIGSSAASITVYEDGRASMRGDGGLIAIDLKNRKITARTPITQNFESDPVLGKDGTVYGGGHDGCVYALESGTGKEKWKYKTGDMLRNSPAVGPDGTVYAGCIDKTLHAIDPSTGEGKWEFPTGHWILPTPVVGPDGTVYVGNNDNLLYAVDPVSGQHKWEFYIGGELRVEPVPAENGLLYVVTDRNMVLCLDQQTGVKQMQYHADSYIHCPPACDGEGNFYFGCNNGKLYAMNVPALTMKAEAEKIAKNPEAAPVEQQKTVEQDEEFIVIDGLKLPKKKEDPGKA